MIIADKIPFTITVWRGDITATEFVVIFTNTTTNVVYRWTGEGRLNNRRTQLTLKPTFDGMTSGEYRYEVRDMKGNTLISGLLELKGTGIDVYEHDTITRYIEPQSATL